MARWSIDAVWNQHVALVKHAEISIPAWISEGLAMYFDPYAAAGLNPVQPTSHVPEFDAGQLVMPFYIICDVSGSMGGEMAALNAALGELFQSIACDPIIDDTVMISIITFDHRASVAVALTAPSEGVVPQLSSGGGTSYAAAWDCYADAVARDYADLKAQGLRLFRPCIFFLTDGEDFHSNWTSVFESRLGCDFDSGKGNHMYPYVVAFGFGAAKEGTLRRLAYPPEHRNVSKPGRYYLANNTGPSEMLKAIIPMIAQSVVNSGRSATPVGGSGEAGPSIELDETWIVGRDIKAGNAGMSIVDSVF